MPRSFQFMFIKAADENSAAEFFLNTILPDHVSGPVSLQQACDIYRMWGPRYIGAQAKGALMQAVTEWNKRYEPAQAGR